MIKIGRWMKIRKRPVYTSVRMLERTRRIAIFCHFSDGLDDCFGWSGCSASSMGVVESEQRGDLRRWQQLLARATQNCHCESMGLFTMFLACFFTAVGGRSGASGYAVSSLSGSRFCAACPTRADESLGGAKGDDGHRRERSGLTKRLLAEGKWGRLAKVPSGLNVMSEKRCVDSRSRAKRRRQT